MHFISSSLNRESFELDRIQHDDAINQMNMKYSKCPEVGVRNGGVKVAAEMSNMSRP